MTAQTDHDAGQQPDPAEMQRLIDEARSLLDRIIGPGPEPYSAKLQPVTCDHCEAGKPGHTADDPKMGGVIHEHLVGVGQGWEVLTTWYEARRSDLEPGQPIYSEHAVYVIDNPEAFMDPGEAQRFAEAVYRAAALQRLAMAWWTDERATA